MVRYCPAGDGEFEDWVARCPECGRTLVGQPPNTSHHPRQPDPHEKIAYLATAPNEPLARMWAEILEDEGIHVMLKPLGPGYGAWASAATFEHELYVVQSQLARAQEIIAEVEQDGGPEASESNGFEHDGDE